MCDDTDDERFMAELRDGRAPVGPMPEEVHAVARAAYAMRRGDAVLAEISDDSVDRPPAGLRDSAGLAGAPRYVGFRAPGAMIRIEVAAHGDHRDIVGRMTPPGASSAEVRWPHASSHHPVDTDGAFVARDIPRGPVSVVLHRPGLAPVSTPWVTM